MHHPSQHALLGDALEVVAGLAELLADALDPADAEALADEVVEADAAGEHLPARLRRGQLDAGSLWNASSASASISVRSRDSE